MPASATRKLGATGARLGKQICGRLIGLFAPGWKRSGAFRFAASQTTTIGKLRNVRPRFGTPRVQRYRYGFFPTVRRQFLFLSKSRRRSRNRGPKWDGVFDLVSNHRRPVGFQLLVLVGHGGQLVASGLFIPEIAHDSGQPVPEP